MTTIEILTLAALIVGPISAVFVTRHLDFRREHRARRMDIFRTLMRTRRVPMSADHVGALNLIEIEFAHESEVLSAWMELFRHFAMEHVRRHDEQLLSNGSPEENRQREERFDKRLFDERQRLLTKVLHAMARTLNFKVEQLEIFEGGYTPQGWENEYVEHRLVRRFLIDLYGARVALPVMVFDPTHPIEPGIPANNGGTKVQAAEPPQAKAKH